MKTKSRSGTIAKTIFGLALLFTTTGVFAQVYSLEEWRCQQQDYIPKDKINDVKGRLDWGYKCYPDVMRFMRYSQTPEKNTFNFPGKGTYIIYPVFGYFTADNKAVIMQAPVDKEKDCDYLAKLAPKEMIQIVGFCGLGCLTGNQVVEFGAGPLPIGSAEAKAQRLVVTLKEGSTAQAMQFQSTPLRQVVTDINPERQEILKIMTASNHGIEVTLNHPLVDGQGLVRRADQLKVGDELIRADGRLEKIASIEQTEIFGKVYNIRVDSPKLEDNIYVSQGFLSGSVAIQNDEVHYLNRKLLRQSEFFSLN